MNAKIRKVDKEIDNAEQKIAEWQDKLKQFKEEKIVLENIEIVNMVRQAKIPTDNISDVMTAFKSFFESEGKPQKMPNPKSFITETEEQ